MKVICYRSQLARSVYRPLEVSLSVAGGRPQRSFAVHLFAELLNAKDLSKLLGLIGIVGLLHLTAVEVIIAPIGYFVFSH